MPAGTYDLKATFGTNPELSLDSPYYEGSAVAEVTADAETQTSIACQVGNALVSVKFGNQDKFDAMYSLYGIKVQVGDLYVRLSNTNSSQSAYFRAGSSPQLSFYGTLKESGQDVSMIIENENLPKVYAARDHAILTLGKAGNIWYYLDGRYGGSGEGECHGDYSDGMAAETESDGIWREEHARIYRNG